MIEISVAVPGPPGDPACRELDGECLVLLEDPAPLRLTRYQAALEEPGDGDGPTLGLSLRPEDAQAFHRLSTAAVGGRLAVVVDGMLVHAPKVRAPLSGTHLKLSFCGQERFTAVRRALFERAP